jgi:hypothetical protein
MSKIFCSARLVKKTTSRAQTSRANEFSLNSSSFELYVHPYPANKRTKEMDSILVVFPWLTFPLPPSPHPSPLIHAPLLSCDFHNFLLLSFHISQFLFTFPFLLNLFRTIIISFYLSFCVLCCCYLTLYFQIQFV